MTKKTQNKSISSNKKAFYNYHIKEKVEAGIVLQGCEVKSIRQGNATLQDSFAKTMNGEMWLLNAYIKPYEQGNRHNSEPRRDRKLLLHKQEIQKLEAKMAQKGFVLVPLNLYFCKNKVKIEMGLGQAKKLHDKRKDLKEKQLKRQLQRKTDF